MRIDVTLPSLGDEDDAVKGAAVAAWLADIGDTLAAGDDLLEVTTDKAAFVVPCPVAGTLVEHSVAEGDVVKVADKLAVLEA